MDDRYESLISEFSEEERILLRKYLSELFEYKDKKEWKEGTRGKFKEIIAEVKSFEKRAKAKIDERKNNPACSFCKRKAEQVEKMFNHTDYLNICSDCVKGCYEQL